MYSIIRREQHPRPHHKGARAAFVARGRVRTGDQTIASQVPEQYLYYKKAQLWGL